MAKLWEEVRIRDYETFCIFRKCIAVRGFLFGFYPSNSVKGEDEELFITYFNPPILLSKDNLIAREEIIGLFDIKKILHLLINYNKLLNIRVKSKIKKELFKSSKI